MVFVHTNDQIGAYGVSVMSFPNRQMIKEQAPWLTDKLAHIIVEVNDSVPKTIYATGWPEFLGLCQRRLREYNFN